MHPLLTKILDPPLIPIPLIFFDQPILKLKGNKNALKHENISLAPGSRNVCQNKSDLSSSQERMVVYHFKNFRKSTGYINTT